MSYYSATLEPMPTASFRPCGFRKCSLFATHFLNAGGQRQFCICSMCGVLAIEADRKSPGAGWTAKVDRVALGGRKVGGSNG